MESTVTSNNTLQRPRKGEREAKGREGEEREEWQVGLVAACSLPLSLVSRLSHSSCLHVLSSRMNHSMSSLPSSRSLHPSPSHPLRMGTDHPRPPDA